MTQTLWPFVGFENQSVLVTHFQRTQSESKTAKATLRQTGSLIRNPKIQLRQLLKTCVGKQC
ncbi:hypothetical protein BOO21_19165 [Vibrio cidicii]|nr:hypothetical protein [Vibrio cidicii]